MNMFGLLSDIQSFLCFCLHRGSQFIAGNAGFEIRFTRMLFQMLLVQARQQIEILSLQGTAQLRWRVEIEDSRFFGSQYCSLE